MRPGVRHDVRPPDVLVRIPSIAASNCATSQIAPAGASLAATVRMPSARDLLTRTDASGTERPCERVWRRGTAALADDELVAMVLGPGKRTQRADAAALQLVRSAGGVAGLSRATPRELAAVVGTARGARVAAAFELGRRAVQATLHRDRLGGPEDVFRIAAPRMLGLAQEIFLVIGVDVRNGLLEALEIARGTTTGVEVHPREVFRPLIRMAAAGGILAHNHPSGDPTPSAEDLALTRRLRAVGQLLGIPIVDHVVVAQHGYRSISEWAGMAVDGDDDDGTWEHDEPAAAAAAAAAVAGM